MRQIKENLCHDLGIVSFRGWQIVILHQLHNFVEGFVRRLFRHHQVTNKEICRCAKNAQENGRLVLLIFNIVV